MKRSNKYIFLLLLILGISIPTSVIADPAAAPPAQIQEIKTVPSEIDTSSAVNVTPLALVANPSAYLNKVVIMNAKFNNFSTVGLDYPPALRKTEDYIGLMVFRDNTQYDIPLSELKMFLKREDAQKFVDLKSKDEVKIVGKVFSTALGDPWVDILSLESINKK